MQEMEMQQGFGFWVDRWMELDLHVIDVIRTGSVIDSIKALGQWDSGRTSQSLDESVYIKFVNIIIRLTILYIYIHILFHCITNKFQQPSGVAALLLAPGCGFNSHRVTCACVSVERPEESRDSTEPGQPVQIGPTVI